MEQIKLSIKEISEKAGTLEIGKEKTVRADAVRIFICGGNWFGLVPPRTAVNEFFLSGSTGGKDDEVDVIYEWEPFELDEAQYRAMVSGLMGLPGQPFKEDRSIPEENWSHHALLRMMGESEESDLSPPDEDSLAAPREPYE